MVHGSGHTGKTYEETPDGRIGWAEYFVRRGVSVYVVDHAGRARSGFDPTPGNRAKLIKNPALIPSFAEFTNEQAWTAFRFGPTAFTPYDNTQFPIAARVQYFAQIVPNTETSYPEAGDTTVAALSARDDVACRLRSSTRVRLMAAAGPLRSRLAAVLHEQSIPPPL